MIGASASATNRGIIRIRQARAAEALQAIEAERQLERKHAEDLAWSAYASEYRHKVAAWLVPIVQPFRATARSIMTEVCRKHGISRDELCSASRARHLVAARHEVFYRLRSETGLSLPRIGHLVGGRDHTTVLHGVRSYSALISREAA